MSELRLFVQEGDKRRAFKLGEGVLTIGSGPGARLQLASPDVAAFHARLDTRGGRVRLVLEPGVAAPRVDGIAMAREALELTPGRRVQIGAATLWVQGEVPAPPPATARPTAPPSPGEPAVPAVRPPTVVRRSRPSKKGLPAWAISGIFVLVVGAIGLFVWRAFLFSAEQAAPEAATRIQVAQALFDQGRMDEALGRLDLAEKEELTAAERAQVEALRTKIADLRAEAEAARKHADGARLFSWLEKYEKESLAGAPDVPRVRLFLKRARQFREEYPGHPSLDWLDRQESRFAGIVDLDDPADWPSVKWEVRSFVRGMPRNYRGAFACLDGFLARTPEGPEHDQAARYKVLLAEERDEHHEDRIAYARELYGQNEVRRAVWWLVHQVIWSDAPELADEAAGVLIKFPDAYDHLRGYEESEPEKFELLMENEIVFKFFHAREIVR